MEQQSKKKEKAIAFRYYWGKACQVSGRMKITVHEILAEASTGADGTHGCGPGCAGF